MTEPAALPLPDYDHLTVGDLSHRIRSLDADALQTLLTYERDHADRLPVVQVLTTRLEEVRGGEPLSGGTAAAPSHPSMAAPAPDTGSVVTPATSGPAMNPPSHGVPTNPAQPRSTG
jgi:hypothetical protein